MAVFLSLTGTKLPGSVSVSPSLRVRVSFSNKSMLCITISSAWYPLGNVPTTSRDRFSLAGASTVTDLYCMVFYLQPLSCRKARMRRMAVSRCSTLYA